MERLRRQAAPSGIRAGSHPCPLPLGRGVPRSNGRHDVEAGRTRRGDEPRGLLFAQVDALDLGAARALAAELEDLLAPRAGAGEDGLDAAVLAVAHPAVEGTLDRVLLDEIAKAHPLHAAMDGDVDEAAVGHELSWAKTANAGTL